LAKLALTAEEGQGAFERLISLDPLTQIVVSTGDLRTRIDQWIKLTPLQDTDQTVQDAEKPPQVGSPLDHPRPHLRNAYAAPRNELEQAIANVWREVLGIDQVGIHDNFFNMGGHSLMALQVLSRLRRAFQVEVSVRVFFDVPTVAGLAEAIEKTRAQAEQAEHKEVARLLAELEGLPEDEARRLLADGPE
jgi:acyl carrier protein